MTSPLDDPSDRPTRMAQYDVDGWQQVLEQEPESTDGVAQDPWYRHRVLLGLWALAVALLLTLIVYGIVELSRGGGETRGPAGPTSSTTPTQSSTTSPTATPSTNTDTPPPESPEQTPEEAPPANDSPAPAGPPPHHHHLPHVPSTITLPHTVITLPHGG